MKQDTDEGQKTDVAADGVDDAYYIFEAEDAAHKGQDAQQRGKAFGAELRTGPELHPGGDGVEAGEGGSEHTGKEQDSVEDRMKSSRPCLFFRRQKY